MPRSLKVSYMHTQRVRDSGEARDRLCGEVGASLDFRNSASTRRLRTRLVPRLTTHPTHPTPSKTLRVLGATPPCLSPPPRPALGTLDRRTRTTFDLYENMHWPSQRHLEKETALASHNTAERENLRKRATVTSRAGELYEAHPAASVEMHLLAW